MRFGTAQLVAFVATTDLDRAREFYEGVLGLTVTGIDPFAWVFDAGGTTLRVTKVAELRPHPFTVLGWQVPDIDVAVAATPVTFLRFDGMDQDERGIWTAPGGAKVAWFADPDGNTLSFSQH